MTAIDLLQAARELASRKERRSAYDSIIGVTGKGVNPLIDALEALAYVNGCGLVEWEGLDGQKRTHAEVLAAFDEATSLLMSEEVQ